MKGITRTVTAAILIVIVVAAGSGLYFYQSMAPKPVNPVSFAFVNSSPGAFEGGAAWYGLTTGGYAAQQGINITHLYRISGATKVVQAIIAGTADIGLAGDEAVLSAITAGAPLKVIMVAESHVDNPIIARNNIQSIQDLTGKTLAITSPSSLIQYQLAALLQDSGISTTAVNWLSAGSQAARTAAVIAGKADLTIGARDDLLNPQFVQTLNASGAYVMAPSYYAYAAQHNLQPYHSGEFIFTTESFIQNHPDAVKGFMAALLLEYRATQASGMESAFVSLDHATNFAGNYTDAQLSTIWTRDHTMFPVDGLMSNKTSVAAYINDYYSFDHPTAAQTLNVNNVFDWNIANQTLSQIGAS